MNSSMAFTDITKINLGEIRKEMLKEDIKDMSSNDRVSKLQRVLNEYVNKYTETSVILSNVYYTGKDHPRIEYSNVISRTMLITSHPDGEVCTWDIDNEFLSIDGMMSVEEMFEPVKDISQTGIISFSHGRYYREGSNMTVEFNQNVLDEITGSTDMGFLLRLYLPTGLTLRGNNFWFRNWDNNFTLEINEWSNSVLVDHEADKQKRQEFEAITNITYLGDSLSITATVPENTDPGRFQFQLPKGFKLDQDIINKHLQELNNQHKHNNKKCDCGAASIKGTHSNWCSTQGDK